MKNVISSNQQVLSSIKSACWNNRQKWLSYNPDVPLISAYKIIASLEKPKDWNAIAQKCSINPTHMHYGKTAEEILSIWQSSSKTGADRGNSLDDYISARLSNVVIDRSTYDDALVRKCSHFDTLYDNVLTKMHSYVGSEIWLNSYELGITTRLDSLFTISSNKELLVSEWKNTERGTLSNKWDKFLGPASHLDNCDLNKWIIQTHIYRFVLEELGLFDSVQTRIFNITQIKNNTYAGFDYDPEFIRAIVAWSRA